jgi:tetratricopeptide (TPR) repeat protein
MESESFFDARTCYEDGLKCCSDDVSSGDMKTLLSERIVIANHKLAERNFHEAECAHLRGDSVKAIDHLELVKTLSYDQSLREKADKLLLDYSANHDDKIEQITVSSCGSCAGSSSSECATSPQVHSDDSLPMLEYYELLIQQLPQEEYQRYAGLGEDFACAYIAASRDEHHEALSGFERCVSSLPYDIYCFEKGKVLHRLGNDYESEQLLRSALQCNANNSLAWFTLVLILRESGRFQEALPIIEKMVSEHIMPEQALLLRADILDATGDHENAVNQYVELLQTSHARTAAEKLYGILIEIGRHSDAAMILKKYLKKSCH